MYFKLFVFNFVLAFSLCEEVTKPEIPKEILVTNGVPATPGQFPYQAALFFEDENNKFSLCSGSLIKEDYILTAAHCTTNAIDVLVYVGIIDISATVDPTAIVNAANFTIHEKFSPDAFHHDIALIKLPQKLTLNENISVVPIWTDKVKAQTTVEVSGWGQISVNNTNISPLLNFADLKTIGKEKCKETFGDLITKNVFCAALSSEEPKPCIGDSGSPAIVKTDDKPNLVGLLSFGENAKCESGSPSAFTRISAYLSWIQEKTKN